MNPTDFESVAAYADLFGISHPTIYRWIRDGKLYAVKEHGKYRLPLHENSQIIRDHFEQRRLQPRQAWVPYEIRDYNEWHRLLDEFCWLLKICYSNRSQIKRRKFRLDQLFANYLQYHRVTLRNVGRIFSSNQTPFHYQITDDLKRGWYNELSYSLPIRKSSLGLSFSDIEENKNSSEIRFAFPSWKIVTAYYSIYFYLRACTLQKLDNFRLDEHTATIRAFKGNLLPQFEQVIWKFPFDISYDPAHRVYRRDLLIEKLDYTHYKYARHPRTPNASPIELFENLYSVFRRRGRKGSRPKVYTLFDYLHEFRVWANYLDIDNLLNLSGSGYKAFLDQNLSTILFFIGGFTEISYMSLFGVLSYIAQLQSLYELFSTSSPHLESEFVNSPLHQRFVIYNRLGLIRAELKLAEAVNPHEVQISE